MNMFGNELEDIKMIAERPYDWAKLNNKISLINVGTGVIGALFCDVIEYRNRMMA